MNTKKIPSVISLIAALVALVVCFMRGAELIELLITLFLVLLGFYILGLLVKLVADRLIVLEEEAEEAEEAEEVEEEAELENIDTENTE